MKYTPESVKEIIKEKVDGKIIAAHDDKGHHYKFVKTGVVVDSVTTKNILDKPHLIKWAIGLAIDFLEIGDGWMRLKGPEREEMIKSAKLQYTDVRDNAGSIGGQAHAIIEEYENEWMNTGVKPVSIMTFIKSGTPSAVIAACRSAEKVFDKYNVVPIAAEILVGISPIGAGTLDLIVLNQKGELELWDHKTSNNVDDYYAVQTSAYRFFFEKMTGLKIKRTRILKIDKHSDKFKVYNVPEQRKAYDAFKALSKVYDWKFNGQDKLIEDKIIVKI
jgi:hypothetical protein